jgi:hypothetical protein
VFNWKVKFLCRESQGACRQDEPIGGKPPVVKWLSCWSDYNKKKIQRKEHNEKIVQKRRSFHGPKRYEATTNESTADWNIVCVF